MPDTADRLRAGGPGWGTRNLADVIPAPGAVGPVDVVLAEKLADGAPTTGASSAEKRHAALILARRGTLTDADVRRLGLAGRTYGEVNAQAAAERARRT